MKIFSIKRLLGLAALYGAAQYAKKHGGARNAFNGLLDKVRTAANAKKEDLIGSAHDQSVGSSDVSPRTGFADENTGYGGGSYGGYSSGGVGGNNNRH